MKILVTGKNGQLGSEIESIIHQFKEFEFLFTDSKELDISNKLEVETFFKKNKFNAVINCAAYTAVDLAENEFEKANSINHLGIKYISKMCQKYNCKLIHISTDYVFDGTNCIPYEEKDKPNPQSIYGKTKLDGENILKTINPKNSIVIRTSWVYSNYGKNFVKTMIKLGKEKKELGVIIDQIGTPTYAKDLAKVILQIIPKIKNKNVELYHFSNEGVCSWYDFAKTIFELLDIKVKVNAIESSQYPTAAKRPQYSVLNKKKIKNTFQIEVAYWKDSLIDCLQQNTGN